MPLFLYLETLTSRAYLAVYAPQQTMRGLVWRFLSAGAPQAMRRSGTALLLAFLTQVGTPSHPQPDAELEFFVISVDGSCDTATQDLAVDLSSDDCLNGSTPCNCCSGGDGVGCDCAGLSWAYQRFVVKLKLGASVSAPTLMYVEMADRSK